MEQFRYIIINIVFTIFLIIGMIILTVHNRQVNGETNLHFLIIIAVIGLMLVFDTWEYFLGQLPKLNMLRYFTTAVCYTLRPVAITVLTSLLFQDRSKRPLLWLPPAVLALFAFTNRYTHWMCYFNDENHWRAGPLRYLPHLISGICFVLLIIETIKRQKEYKSEANHLFYFIVAINVIAAAAETLTDVKFLLTGTMMISCLLYYSLINKQNEIRRAIEHEQELLQSRVSIMLSQIQPHFLYNSLTSIRQLCKNDPDAAQNAIDEFAKYLRGNLDSIKRNTPVPFTEELEHIRIYLHLEKMRFEDDLRIVWDIRAEGFRLPALTVQPLVENAVKYGVGKKQGGGTVTVSSREQADGYIVAVTDDGVGYDPAETKDDGRTHIGIENVRQRLAVVCGGRLTIETAPGEGTTATIYIPKKEAGE